MVVTFFLCGVILAVGSWKFYRSKRAYDKEISILKVRLDAAKEASAKRAAEIEALKEELRDYRHLCTSGCRNLQIKLFMPFGNCGNRCGTITVAGVDTRNPDLWFVIKDFRYNTDDSDDYDFAMREAEELIEKLNENCLPWNV